MQIDFTDFDAEDDTSPPFREFDPDEDYLERGRVLDTLRSLPLPTEAEHFADAVAAAAQAMELALYVTRKPLPDSVVEANAAVAASIHDAGRDGITDATEAAVILERASTAVLEAQGWAATEYAAELPA